MHLTIVALDSWHVPIPQDFLNLPPGYSHSLKTCTSQLKTVQEIREAVKDATIIVVTVSPLDEVTLSPDVTPNLRLVVAVASGTDNIDRQKCNERRIPVLNSPNSNARSVAEHVIALYFASRRRLFRLHHSVLGTTEWRDRGTLTYKMNTRDNSPPLACSEETVGIIGYGAIGQHVAQLCQVLGMTVLVSSRKSSGSNATDSFVTTSKNEVNRVAFAEVLVRSSVLILCVPRNSETIGLISMNELRKLSPHTILINVSRGGIVDEVALVEALREGLLAGAATDVFSLEPSGAGEQWREGDSPLLKLGQHEADELNLVVTPHVAWYTRATISSYLNTLKLNIEKWCDGKLANVVN